MTHSTLETPTLQNTDNNTQQWTSVGSGWYYSWEQTGVRWLYISAQNNNSSGDVTVKIIKNGSVGLAEAYMDNYFETNNLTNLIELAAKNIKIVHKFFNHVVRNPRFHQTKVLIQGLRSVKTPVSDDVYESFSFHPLCMG